MSLKKGDLVEIIGCNNPEFSKFIGRRFILEFKSTLVVGACRGMVGWKSPFETDRLVFTPLEKYLRKVNLDGDERSDESFESLMKKLKSFTNNNNIVTVDIKLEERNNDCTK